VRILADGYYDPESMIGLADRAGLSVSEIDLSGRPTATASSMIRVASRHRRLRQLAEVMLADDHLGTLQLDLRVLLDDEGGTEQPSLG